MSGRETLLRCVFPKLAAASRIVVVAGVAVVTLACAGPAEAAAVPVTTYHYNNLRTGWDQAETLLTPAAVAGSGFGLLGQVTLDQQVDGQPLFLPGQQIAGGVYDVVYVATEGDTVYAIDAHTGAILVSRNLGTPVSVANLPGQCNSNSSTVGIASTPVIDPATGILYVMALTAENGTQVYRLHALDDDSLADRVPPVIVSAAAPLANGKVIAFDAAFQRQRPALLLTSGTVYAGFGSYCDMGTNVSRGWVLGWQAGTLAPLAGKLIDRRSRSPNTYFMSSVWMAGYGIASDDKGALYFSTGNSDPSGSSYGSPVNLSESVIRLSADLTTIQGHYTPSAQPKMDQFDGDLGSGGVMLVPPLVPHGPALAVIGGKWDNLYLLNRDHLSAAPGIYPNSGCWCGPSYFAAADGVGRVVTSMGHNIQVWRVLTTPSASLVQESTGPYVVSGGDPGFLTTISSNGTTPATTIIWAVPHPDTNDTNHVVKLMAFDPGQGAAQVFSAPAGSWPYAANADANLVPLVANGRVFVASYGQLSIFGLTGHALAYKTPAAPQAAAADTRYELHGTVVSVAGSLLSMRLRDGDVATVDIAAAAKSFRLAQPAPGRAILVRGDRTDPGGHLLATAVLPAKDIPQLWAADR